eukprot:UN24292
MEPTMRTIMKHIIPKVGTKMMPTVWSYTPETVKNAILDSAIADCPDTLKIMLEDMKLKINDVFDLKDMAKQALIKEPDLLNYIFLNVGAKEFVLYEILVDFWVCFVAYLKWLRQYSLKEINILIC